MPDEQPTDALDELRRLGSAAGAERVEWLSPPPDLWARIAADAFPSDDMPTSDDAASMTPPAREQPVVTSPVVSLEEHRRSRGWWLVGAAAAIIVVVAAMTTWVRQTDDATVLASTELEPLGASGQGSAEVVERDGALQLRLVTDGVDATDGFAEVWLINTDVTQLISLGPIRSDGTYDLPAGLDPAAFPIVDVSFESFDGNPQHSGNSVLRGELIF